jgi:NADPH:quinone reductase-like Zn-dependent oxidoreductase/acyl carrier protein
MAIGAQGFCSQLTTKDMFVRRLPDDCQDEDAATIPVAWLTAEYALRIIGRVAPGERVLIHAAAGGVGMAAVRLARELGADVFATAGSETKRRILREMGVEHVMDSRSLDFAGEIRRITGGAGIDVVLNSLTGEAIDRGFSVLRAGGRFLEIGKTEWRNPDDVHAAWPGIHYVIVDLTQVIRDEPHRIGAMLDRIGDALDQGRLTALPRQLFGIDEARDAFRFMAQARHVGKVVVCHRPPDGRCRPDGTYVVTGGAGALGLRMAQWLAERGARHLVLVGRSSPSRDAAEAIAALVADGVDVRFASCDVTRLDHVRALVGSIPADRPLRGVVHAAGVLDDGIIADMTAERLAAVMAPKVDGAWNLHAATRERALDLFVLFSSSAGVFGAAGQGNYAAGNTFLDALAHHRRAIGLAALAVDWGPWSTSGMAARLEDRDRARLAATGVRPLDQASALHALDVALTLGKAQVLGIEIDWSALWATLRDAATPALLAEMGQTGARRSDGAARAPEAATRLDLIALPAAERGERLSTYVRDQLRAVLALEPGAVQTDDTFVALGMDSLTAVELRNRLQQGLGLRLAATTVLEHPSVAALTAFILETLPRAAADAEGAAGAGRETLDL